MTTPTPTEMTYFKIKINKEQIERVVVGAIRTFKKEHPDGKGNLSKRITGAIYGFIKNNDGVRK